MTNGHCLCCLSSDSRSVAPELELDERNLLLQRRMLSEAADCATTVRVGAVHAVGNVLQKHA